MAYLPYTADMLLTFFSRFRLHHFEHHLYLGHAI